MTPDYKKILCGALNKPGSASSDFDLNKNIPGAAQEALKPAAVLVAFRADTGALILTKRSARLKHHPGQIAFAGGKQDPEDTTPTAAALREAREEIGLCTRQVTVLGTLPHHATVTQYEITPVVALVDPDFVPVPEQGEVSEVFEVPFDHVINPENFAIAGRHWLGQRRQYYAVPYGPYYIWGATARILRALAERLQP